jgi:hypothetical protein
MSLKHFRKPPLYQEGMQLIEQSYLGVDPTDQPPPENGNTESILLHIGSVYCPFCQNKMSTLKSPRCLGVS